MDKIKEIIENLQSILDQGKYDEIVNIIKSLRKQNNISSYEMASRLEIVQSSYNMKENKKVPFTSIEFLNICNILNLDLTMSYTMDNNNHIIENDYICIVNTIVKLREYNNITKDSMRIMLNISFPNYINKENLKSKKPFYLAELINIFTILGININLKYSYIDSNGMKVNSEFNLLDKN
ncbi:helix-turn-helix domain-containing protein [Paraclostridium sordellii]|uniref:helix-turn-helix domain-containing protein n=5 Tax=Paraclostridium sordellii TaxID=1505 RepID=UPI0022E4E7A7|nr:helix-turn-helix transcriptional regulator [Paeniclostridium sordellii]